MTGDEWLKSVRRRTHDLGNLLHAQQGEIMILREQLRAVRSRLEILERQAEVVRGLQHQATVLRWILGLGTTVAAAALVRGL